MSKQFKILCLQSNLFWNSSIARQSDVPTLYDDGKRAEEIAANLTRNTGLKWQVRLHITDTKWRERETKRFYSGEYYPVPWDSQSWWRGSYADLNHFAHVSVEKDTRIAFTPDDESGVADKQRRVKPGVYLQEFFASKLNNDTIKHWAAQFSVLYEKITVKFARTADEIEEVYMQGPRSCMDGVHAKAGNFTRAGMHPCRVYAGPDLAVAYLEKEADDTRWVCANCQERPNGCPQEPRCQKATLIGKYSARCLVWPEKQLYGRVYGDTDRLKLALQRDGYSHASDLIGARLTRIELKTPKLSLLTGQPLGDTVSGFVVPYIDGRFHRVRDDGKYLVIDPDGYINGERADGTGEDMRPRCEECGELSTYKLTRFYNRDCDRINLCTACTAKEPSYVCHESGYRIRRRDAIVLDSGLAVHIQYIDSVVGVCSKTHTMILLHHDPYVNLADGTIVLKSWFEENHGQTCNYCGYGITEKCTQISMCRSQAHKDWVFDKLRMNILHKSQGLTIAQQAMPHVSYNEAYKAYLNERDEQRKRSAEEASRQRAEEIAQRRRTAQRARRARERASLAQRNRDGVPL